MSEGARIVVESGDWRKQRGSRSVEPAVKNAVAGLEAAQFGLAGEAARKSRTALA
jgi:hypothetical protein